MSFQDELRKSIPTKEQEARQAESEASASAQLHYREICSALKRNAERKEYTIQGGMITVSCVVSLPQKYVQEKRWDNLDAVAANQRKLFKDPFLKPTATKTYSVSPEYQQEFTLFRKHLERLAEADGITTEIILYDKLLKWERPFPTRLVGLG